MRRLFLIPLLICAAHSGAADWPQFRGEDHTGISTDANVPLHWSAEKNIKWRTALPSGGNSSPIVSGDRVFVTCAEDSHGFRRSLYCFNRDTGKILWTKSVAYEKADPHHAANPYCGSSPAADGKHVVAWHGSAGLHCYDYDGNELWHRDLGVIRHIWGYAGSPLIEGNSVILNAGPGERSFVIALDLKTGQTIWQTDEPGGAEDRIKETGSWIGSWSTPLAVKIEGKTQILVAMARHVNAYDPATGKIIWTCAGSGDLAYCDPMVNQDLNVCVAMAGYGGAAIGFKLGGAGDITSTHRLWKSTEKPPQRIGTGVMIGKHLFMVQENGFLCNDPLTGKTLWQHREPGQVIWSSLIAAGDRLYATSQKGTTFVIAADPTEYKLLAMNEVGEKSNSSVAIAGRQVFLRTFEHLYCFEE